MGCEDHRSRHRARCRGADRGAARIERFVRLAQRLELPVYGFEVRGRDVTVLTRPRDDAPAEKPAAESDPVARWFSDNAAGDPESAGKRKAS